MPDKQTTQNIDKSEISTSLPDMPVDIDQPGSDSVSEDINKFKKYFRQFTGGVQTKTKPVVEKVQKKVIEKTPQTLIDKVPKKGGFGWIKFLFVPIFIVFVALIMLSVAKNVVDDEDVPGDGEVSTGTVEPTPTLEPFQPVKDSVYAEDPQILLLQEEINVINNEMFSIPLRDSTINPPVLDFNIDFGKK